MARQKPGYAYFGAGIAMGNQNQEGVDYLFVRGFGLQF